jgi:MFS family permease
MDRTNSSPAPLAALMPIMGIVFIGFLIIGMAMPVLPLHVHDRLGLGTFMVGLVAGAQFAASLVSRMAAGRHADERGPRQAVVVGLLMSSAGGLLYLLSLGFLDRAAFSIAILLLGRAVLGAGESFIITGAQAWGVALAGSGRTGQVLAWMGTAMYGAFALGAPVGTALYGAYGFAAIALATAGAPLVTLALAAKLHGVPPTQQARPALISVVAAVWLPGTGLALSSFGFGAMTAFVSLLFAARGWTVWPAFTTFAAAFMLARGVLGHVADRRGGANVALLFVIIEAAGQASLWASSSPALGLAGCALTGFGYSLVYPGFGVEAVRRAPRESRGLAMGAYTAFLDLTLAIASPALGLVAALAGIGSVFLTSAIVVLGAAAVALRLRVPTGRAARAFVADRQPTVCR